MLDTTEPIPKGFPPLARITFSDRYLHSFVSLLRSTRVPDGNAMSMGVPLTTAVDQATTSDLPRAPSTERSIEFGLIWNPFSQAIAEDTETLCTYSCAIRY
jgi:hypothetical protein